MRMRVVPFTVALLLLVTAGCSSSDPTASDEYAALDQELAQTSQALVEAEAQLTAVTAEREAQVGGGEPTSTRHENARANQETLLAIIKDPSAFGSEQEVLDLLDEMAIPEVVSGDLAFGGVRTGIWRVGWRNTLFGGMDATIHTWTSWLSEDGSVGGSLWTWSGSAQNGEPFDLQSLEISRFDDEGLYTEVIMQYPYENAEVHRRIAEGN